MALVSNGIQVDTSLLLSICVLWTMFSLWDMDDSVTKLKIWGTVWVADFSIRQLLDKAVWGNIIFKIIILVVPSRRFKSQGHRWWNETLLALISNYSWPPTLPYPLVDTIWLIRWLCLLTTVDSLILHSLRTSSNLCNIRYTVLITTSPTQLGFPQKLIRISKDFF